MLSNASMFTTIAVRDLIAAEQFYGTTLGLTLIDESPSGVMYESGQGRLFIYESATAGSGQATCVAWAVEDVEATVDELTSRGVTFEVYDSIPGAVQRGDVYVMGEEKAAWFKDPDGNILSVCNATISD